MYGSPGNAHEGKELMTPGLKDMICSYFYLLGVDPNLLAQEILEGYINKKLDVTTLRDNFVIPARARGVEESEDKWPEDDVAPPQQLPLERPSNSREHLSEKKKSGGDTNTEE